MLIKVYATMSTDGLIGMALKKGQKQDRGERTQKDYPTSARIHNRCRVVLRSFISAGAAAET